MIDDRFYHEIWAIADIRASAEEDGAQRNGHELARAGIEKGTDVRRTFDAELAPSHRVSKKRQVGGRVIEHAR